jgi:hypothetical protein
MLEIGDENEILAKLVWLNDIIGETEMKRKIRFWENIRFYFDHNVHQKMVVDIDIHDKTNDLDIFHSFDILHFDKHLF